MLRQRRSSGSETKPSTDSVTENGLERVGDVGWRLPMQIFFRCFNRRLMPLGQPMVRKTAQIGPGSPLWQVSDLQRKMLEQHIIGRW